jgi:hypothetical protein
MPTRHPPSIAELDLIRLAGRRARTRLPRAIVVSYDGEGDSGGVERISVERADRTVEDVPRAREDAELLEDLCLSVVCERFYGFENNDGGYGEVLFDLAGASIALRHVYRDTESETADATVERSDWGRRLGRGALADMRAFWALLRNAGAQKLAVSFSDSDGVIDVGGADTAPDPSVRARIPNDRIASAVSLAMDAARLSRDGEYGDGSIVFDARAESAAVEYSRYFTTDAEPQEIAIAPFAEG